jgi:hypothetical protein
MATERHMGLEQTPVIYLDGWTEHLVVSCVRTPTNALLSSGFLIINTFQFYPDMFRHMVAILRGTGADCDLSGVTSCCEMCPLHTTPLG